MYISLENCEEIVAFAVGNCCEVEEFEGSLVDSYIIYADKKLRVGNKTANYIVIRGEYQNEWSSALKLSFINCEKRIENIRKKLSQ